MTLRNVEITSVTEKDKGLVAISYKGEHTKGDVWTVNTFPANLAEEYRDELRAAKAQTESGQVAKVAVEISKEGNFWELKKVTKPVTESKKTYSNNNSGYSKNTSSKEDGFGAQVGNALNVAAITLGAGATVEAIEARAEAVLSIGERLKKKLQTIKDATSPTTEAKVNTTSAEVEIADTTVTNTAW